MGANAAIVNVDIPIPIKYPPLGFNGSNARLIDAIYIPCLNPKTPLASNLEVLSEFSNQVVLLCSRGGPDLSERLPKVTIYENLATSMEYTSFLEERSSMNPSLLVRRDYDLPFKRTMALKHAKECGFQLIGLLDDDIELTDLHLRKVGLCFNENGIDIAGFHVLDYPDVSTIDHVERFITRRRSKVSMGGNCLFFKVDRVFGKFPYVYNEDWLFLLSHLSTRRVVSLGYAKQRPHKPWLDPLRIRFEQFGEVIITGVKLNILQDKGLLWGDEAFWREVLSQYVERLHRLFEKAPAEWRPSLETAMGETETITVDGIMTFITTYENERSNT